MKKGKKALAVLLTTAMAWGSVPQTYGAAGWQNENGRWYYKDGDTKTTGWISEGQDLWYFLDSTGAMQTGWQQIGTGTWFRFNEPQEGTEGQMRYGWYQGADGSWYYLSTEHDGSFGKMVTGWAWIDGFCYYFGENGRMYADEQTPDGYTVDAEGRWVVDGKVQAVMGKGYESRHKHENPSTASKKGSSSKSYGSSSGNSSSGGNNSPGEKEPEKGVFEKSARSVYESTEAVKTFDTATEQGKNELKQFYDTIISSWISALPDSDESDFVEDNAREIELAVSNDNPLLKYIEEGKMEEGDVIYIPASSDNGMPLALVYEGHDDSFSGDQVLNGAETEVLHTREASLRQIFGEALEYSAGGVNPKQPLAFEWKFNATGTELDEENQVLPATPSNASVNLPLITASSSDADEIPELTENIFAARVYAAAASSSGTRNKMDTGFKYDDKTGTMKIGMDVNTILYDGDGNYKTTKDQVVLKGTYELSDIYPSTAIDWPLLSNTMGSLWRLDFAPNQLMAKVSCKEAAELRLEFSPDINMENVIKAINKANGLDGNSFDINLFAIEGVDLKNTAVLWAGGINVGTGAVGINMESLQFNSVLNPLSPTIVIMILLDVDGNISVKAFAQIEKESYHELGVNYQEKGYYGVGGSTEDNEGTYNHEIGNHVMNIYAKDQKSETNSQSSGYKITAGFEGEAGLDAAVNLGAGLMFIGIMPVIGKTGVGIDLEAESSCELEATEKDAIILAEGKAQFEFYRKTQLLAKLRVRVGDGDKISFCLFDISPEWKDIIFKKEFTETAASKLRLRPEVPKYFKETLNELKKTFVEISKYESEDYISYDLANDSSISPWPTDLGNHGIVISVVKAKAGAMHAKEKIFDISNGALRDDGTLFVDAGPARIFDGLNDETTLDEVIQQLNLNGEFGFDGEGSEYISYSFEKDGLVYNIVLGSMYNDMGHDWTEDMKPLEKDIEEAKAQKLRDNQVVVHVTPKDNMDNIGIYDYIEINNAEKTASCQVPSGETWSQVIKTDTNWLMLNPFGRNTISFDYQFETDSNSEWVLSMESFDGTLKAQKITAGTNHISFQGLPEGQLISIFVKNTNPNDPIQKGTLYIRNAILQKK